MNKPRYAVGIDPGTKKNDIYDTHNGPLIKIDTICLDCGSVCNRRLNRHWGCDKCDAWTDNVFFIRRRAFDVAAA